MKAAGEGHVPLPSPYNEAFDRFMREAGEISGTSLRKVILYGSFARGDADKESDIDLLVVWAGPVKEALDLLVPIASQIFLDTNVEISIHPVPEGHLERIRGLGTGFSQRIDSEGVIVS